MEAELAGRNQSVSHPRRRGAGSPGWLRLLRGRQSRKQLTLAWPIMLQALLGSMMGFVDSLMVGQLGEQVISALGNGAQLLMFGHLLLAALSMGGGVLLAQYCGAGKHAQLGQAVSTLMLAGLLGGGLLGLSFLLAGEGLAGLLTLELFNPVPPELAVAPLTGRYLWIVGWSLPLVVLGNLLAVAFQSTGDTRTPVRVSLIFNLVNVLGNWLLIFGGAIPYVTQPLFTPLGYQGAAIATLFAGSGTGLTLLWLALAKRRGQERRGQQRPWHGHLTRPDAGMLRQVISIGYPMSVDGFYWQGARVFYTVLMNAIGPQAFAAYVIVRTLKGLFMLPASGMQAAAGIVAGQLLGAGNLKRARLAAHSGLLLALAVVVVPAVALVLGADHLLALYRITPQTAELARVCLWILALSMFATAVNAVVPGLLRAGGDTRSVMHITLVCFLLVGAPASYLLGIVLGGGLIGAFAGIALEEVAKAFVMLWRLRKGYWLRRLV